MSTITVFFIGGFLFLVKHNYFKSYTSVTLAKIIGKNIFPENALLESELGSSLQAIFWISYSLYASYSFVMAAALFYRPRVFKWVLVKLFSIRFLRRWKHDAQEYGDQIIEEELAKSEPLWTEEETWF